MRVLVLGAGASRHAGYPLAADMGHCLADWINTLPTESEHRWCLQRITSTYGTLNDFETILGELITCPPGSKAEGLGGSRPYVLDKLKEAIRSHFEAIWTAPMPLYERLAAVVRQGDTVITFNYDLATERALRRAGKWEITTGYGFVIGNQPQASRVEVLKLHGSINWRGLLFGGRPGGGTSYYDPRGDPLGYRPVLFFRPALEYLGYPDFVDPLCEGLDSARGEQVLIMPAIPKRFDQLKRFWDFLWQRAKDVLENADEIAIIGYSLPVADQRAQNLVLCRANKSARLKIFCHKTTAELEQAFRDNKFSGIESVGTTFEDFLASEGA